MVRTPDLASPFTPLAESGPFARVPADQRAAWFARATVDRLEPTKRSEPPVAWPAAQPVWAILRGTLGVYLRAPDGSFALHDQLGPGAIAGGPDWPDGAAVRAESPCEFARWERADVTRLLAGGRAVEAALEAFARERDAVREVVDHALFQKLRESERRSLLRFVRIEHAARETAFIRQGEYTGDFYVVLSGIVTAYRVEPDGTRRQLVQIGPGQWFGETSALSNQPSPAKLQADTPCVYAVLAPGLFKELYTPLQGSFRKAVDEGYRQRGLAIHLSTVPVLRGLPRDAVTVVQRLARFERVAKGAVVAEEGKPADSVFLVRSGALETHVVDGPGRRLTGYLMTNSSFGEHALSESAPTYPATYTAMSDTDLLVLPADELRQGFARVPGALEQLAANVREQASAEADAEELAVMAQGQSAKGGEALVIDLEKCVRCNACVESCVAVHADRVPRLSKRGQRVSASANQLKTVVSLVTSCYSCGTPGCMLNCHYGAIRRNSRGLIRFLWDNCVGCAECIRGCPYDVIRLTPPPDQMPPPGPGWLAAVPGVGDWLAGLFGPRAASSDATSAPGYRKEIEPRGKAVKCDRCEGLPFEACVYNCPTGAIERRSPAALFGRSTGPEAGR